VAEQLAKVGDVIQPGEVVPDNVVGVLDCQDDDLVLNALGHWHSPSAADVETCRRDVPCGVEPITDYAPLTVTAVREPEPAEDVHYYITEYGPSGTTLCGEGVEEGMSTTDEAGKATCEACRTAADEDAPKSQTVRVTMALGIDDRDGKAVISTHHLGEIGSCDRQVFLDAVAETFGVSFAPPQPADASVLLDLVRQYGDENRRVGSASASGSVGAPVVHEYKRQAAATFDRIAALVPQHPVQARDEGGLSLWLHPCGVVMPFRVPPNGEAHHCYPVCKKPGPWRPLLVGGDPAPERPGSDAYVAKRAMAELGVNRPEDVVGAIRSARNALVVAERQCDEHHAEAADYATLMKLTATERDEARAEVERLKAANELLEAQRLDAWAHVHALDAAQPDPLVLTLPQGAVALIGERNYRVRYARKGTDDLWISDETDGGYSYKLFRILEREGSVRVELAPREPRTWKQLDAAPADIAKKLEVRQPGGTQFVVSLRGDGRWASTIAFPNPENAEPHETFAWSELLGEGDVTEVFDEPGGQQR
jgi:hypothetical protein